MVTSTPTIELGWAAELGGNDDERLVEHVPRFEIGNERGEGGVEFLDQLVLFQDALVVGVPAGAVEEVEVIRNLNETDALLDEPAAEQTAMSRSSRRVS